VGRVGRARDDDEAGGAERVRVPCDERRGDYLAGRQEARRARARDVGRKAQVSGAPDGPGGRAERRAAGAQRRARVRHVLLRETRNRVPYIASTTQSS
jgi:hypothetical protein